MYSMETITAFLGWCTVINIAILAIATIGIITMRGFVSRIHASLFDLDQAALSRAYFQYLANYKIMIFIFNLVPYLALKVMT
jgi:hypothetical protein